MCNLYRIETSQQAMRRLFGIADDRLGNLPLLDGVYPDQLAPVVHGDGDGRTAEMMRWGFPPPASARRPVTNVRNLDSPFWRSWLARPAQRCLVPATAFCEYEGEVGAKAKRWFALRETDDDGRARPFAFAGIWREWSGMRGKEQGTHRLFSILTTEPNGVVAPIHPKAMPVLLADAAAFERWLQAPWPEAAALAAPFPDERMRLLPDQPEPVPLFAG
ncbi:MAG: SOS response-associated peptidase family protein [Alphaproteobacteria bacterium]